MQRVNGGVCTVKNIEASGCKNGKYGVGILLTKNCEAAGVFTKNKIKAAPVRLTKKVLRDGKLSAIVANSGNANCFTGKKGMEDAIKMQEITAEKLNLDPNEVAVASTGIIGLRMPMEKIIPLINKASLKLNNSPKASRKFAKAIMTTDTFPKEFAVEFRLKNGEKCRIGGVAKGAGMISPNMATMLSFITTDIDASADELYESLKIAVDRSFNMVVVDGDQSTNDMVLISSTRESGEIDEKFQTALNFLCEELAKMIAKDGEGATKFIEVIVKNAKSSEDAKKIAKSIVSSPLVKTAVFGSDPNIGRIIAAIGSTNCDVKEEKINIRLKSVTDVNIVKNGEIIKSKIPYARKVMNEKEIKIIVDLKFGNSSAKAYGCDLTYDYVKINSEYST